MRPTTHVGVGLLVILSLALSSGAFAQEAVVHIDPWWSSPANGVVFSEGRGSPDTSPEGVEWEYHTTNNLYDVALDLKSISWQGDCGCFRYYVIYVRTRDTQIVTRHKVRATPSGRFDDQVVTATLKLLSGAPTAQAGPAPAPPLAQAPLGEVDLQLPVAAAQGNQLSAGVELGIDGSSVKVQLFSPQQASLHLHRIWSPVPLLVSVAVAPEAAGFWRTMPKVDAPSVDMATTTQAEVSVALDPKLTQTVQASFLPPKLGTASTNLLTTVKYRNPYFGGRELSFSKAVLVQVYPALGWLFVALIVGVLLGSLARMLIPGVVTVSSSLWARASAAAAIVAVILWLVEAFLVSQGSKFVVVGFDLDPSQILPTVILGVISGLMGFKAAQLLKFIPKE